MTISSRTPEGKPNRCPVCRKSLSMEPSILFGDAPCPHCGTLLWFFALDSATVYCEHESAAPLRERIKEFVLTNLGVSPERIPDNRDLASYIKELGADSLDVVELVMELEAEFGSHDDDDDEDDGFPPMAIA